MEKTVLIIEDVALNRLAYRSYLQREKTIPYVLIEAETPEQGLALWRSQTPDLALVTVADNQGLQLLTALGQGKAGAKLPILVLIPQRDDAIAQQALKLGAMDYLVKEDLSAWGLCHRLGLLLARTEQARAIQNGKLRLSEKNEQLRGLDQQLTQTQMKLSLVEEELKERNLQRESKWLRYQELFNLAPDGYFVTNRWGKIQEANQSALNLLETSGQAILNLPLITLVDPLDQEDFQRHLRQLQQQPQEQTWEMRLKPQQGESFPVEVTVLPDFEVGSDLGSDLGADLAVDSGVLNLHLRWFMHNISDRKQCEAALVKADNLFKTSFDNAAIGMSLSSIEGRLLTVNPAFCRIVGYTEAELLARTFQDITDPDDLSADLVASDQLLRGEISFFNLEKRYKHKNGQSIWTWLTLSLVRDEQEQGLYLIAQIQDIRDRKQAEADLRQLNRELEDRVEQRTAALVQSEARLRESQKVARLGSWELDVITGKVVWSPELFHLYGLNPHHLEPTYEEHLHNNFPPSERERLAQAVSQAIEQGEPYALDLQIIRADGSRGYIVAKGEAAYNEAGQVVRLFGIAMDISDHKQVEQELSQSRELQAVIFNESTDALFWVDPQTQATLDCNQRAVELFDAIDKTELLQVERTRLQRHPFSPQELLEIREQLGLRGYWSRELEYVTLQGDLFWGNVAVKPITVAGLTLNLVRVSDISDRKQAAAQLVASEERFQKIAATSPGIIYILVNPIQKDSYFEYISAAVEEIYEYRPEQILGDASLYFGLIHPEDRPRYDQVLAHSQETLQPFHHEWRILTPSGAVKWIQTNSRPERRANGDLAWYGIILEISDRKQAEAQLQASNADLLRANHDKEAFLVMMSHELRTPLNVILGMTFRLKAQNDGLMSEEQKGALDTIEDRGNHLLSLINDILHFTEIATRPIPLHRLPTAVRPLCESSLRVVEPQIVQKRLQIRWQVSPDLPEFFLDESHIEQILVVLLGNAVKFTPEGGAITLTVNSELPAPLASEPAILRISVQDTGIGIAPADLDHLFQPFFQSDRALTRQYAGIGLGLTLAKRMVESLGGTLTVNSTLGVGSCFTVEFPAEPLFRATEPRVASPTSVFPLADRTESSPLILLAEDNEANRRSIANYLMAQKKNYRFLFAKEGQAAIALTQTQRPDLILLNIQMPDIQNDLEIIPTLKGGDRDLSPIPLIAMSAFATREDRDRCLAAGADDYIPKPVSLKPLATKIQQWFTPARPHTGEPPQSTSPTTREMHQKPRTTT